MNSFETEFDKSLSRRELAFLERLRKFEQTEVYDPNTRIANYFDFYLDRNRLTKPMAKLLNKIRIEAKQFEANNQSNFSSVALNALEELANDGVSICRGKLSGEMLRAIQESIFDLDFRNRKNTDEKKAEELLPHLCSTDSIFGSYFLTNESLDLFHERIGYKLAFDPFLLKVAHNYFRSQPIHVSTSLWFSFPNRRGDNTVSLNAQAFHQDSEFFKFLKVFIYLNDVGTDSGPHVYVRGSHRKPLFKYGVNLHARASDKFVRSRYGAQSLVSINGEAGTVFFADTYGVHKGDPPLTRARLVLQFEYTNSLYLSSAKPFPSIPKSQQKLLDMDMLSTASIFHSDDFLLRHKNFELAMRARRKRNIFSKLLSSMVFRTRSGFYRRLDR